MINQNNEQIAYEFCEDVWFSKKSNDTIISKYLAANTNQSVKDSERKSLLNLSLEGMKEIKPATSMKNIIVLPYSQVKPLAGLNDEVNSSNIYAVSTNNKVLLYLLFDKNRIASFTILQKGSKSYFLTF
jgi:hypothetical protein